MKVVDDPLLLKGSETEILLSLKDNPLLINRSFDGSSNNGIKWTDKERAKVRKTMKNKYKSGALKPVAYKFSPSYIKHSKIA